MSSQKFPYAITKVEGDLHHKMLAAFPGYPDGMVQIGPEKVILPVKFEQFADQIYNFKARPDDVFICTIPRSGTTWVQEMIWLICNDLDYDKAFSTALRERFPMFERNVMKVDAHLQRAKALMSEEQFDKLEVSYEPVSEKLSKMTSRRFIKTHLPIKFLPSSINEVGAKVVYVARNPKDVCVSLFYFHKHFLSEPLFTGAFDSFSKYFTGDMIPCTPYWHHVLNGWQNRKLDNVHFMFYEDCKADLASSLKKLAEFLGHPLKNDDLPKLMHHLSFESFQKNSSINLSTDPKVTNPTFVRRGQVGGNPEMTSELSEKFDKWTEKNLSGTDFEFPIKV